MKNQCLTALAMVAFGATGAFAQEAPAGPPNLPPSALTQINLAGAGLLAPFYADLQYGFTLARVSQSRARNNTVNNGPPTTPTTGYENDSFTTAVPWIFRTPLDGHSNLTFKLAGIDAQEADNLISEDAQFIFAAIGYERMYSPNGMYSVELGYRSTDVDRNDGKFSLNRKNIDLKASFAQKFSDHWGAVGRLIYSPGDTDVDVTTPFGVVSSELSEYYVYSQIDLVGSFTNADMGFIPEGWKFHPQFGLTHMYSSFDSTTNSAGGTVAATDDNYGAGQALARLEKRSRPGSFAPIFALGLEHVFLDDLSDYSNETTYGIFQAGISYLNKNGSVTYVGLHHREGFNGERRATELTIAGNIMF